MADDEITRREALLGIAVLGGGAAVGYAARDRTKGQEAMLGGGGGSGAPSTNNPLHIQANEVLAVSSLTWYDSILWEDGGTLALEDGDALGVESVSNDG